ncbi:MAG: hypothetical protein IJL74_04835 [Bacilli bacterium]|nr:hypothetical protein [Bacilli bacterium]
MAKHISSSEYRYIPIESAIKIAELEEKIRKQDKQIRKLLKENIKLRSK